MDAPPKVFPITAKQQQAWDLRQAGRTCDEIARIMGIASRVVDRHIAAAKKKLGMTDAQVQADSAAMRQLSEFKHPEAAALLIDAATDPLANLEEAYAACGLPRQTAKAIIRRFKTRFSGGYTPTVNLKTSDIEEKLGHKIDLTLSYIDDVVAEQASLRDLALAATALIEKRQLVRGEPTQIISDLERKKLNELLPALIAEGQRRGITVEGVATRVPP
jgi:DNA-binding CsgD family transcriptional regulator